MKFLDFLVFGPGMTISIKIVYDLAMTFMSIIFWIDCKSWLFCESNFIKRGLLKDFNYSRGNLLMEVITIIHARTLSDVHGYHHWLFNDCQGIIKRCFSGKDENKHAWQLITIMSEKTSCEQKWNERRSRSAIVHVIKCAKTWKTERLTQRFPTNTLAKF